ncbi:MAG: hypothetical protein JSW18_00105 [Candidatus Omnitrophota bacterium]|nr:MAG: hypothetical protein JSW18_00105 [Candidatus Omnitrophota bacterium]
MSRRRKNKRKRNKAKARVMPQAEAKAEGMSRRTILKIGLGAGALAGVGGLGAILYSFQDDGPAKTTLEPENLKPEDYARWWEKHFKRTKGRAFLHNTYRPEVDIGGERVSDLKKELEHKLGEMIQQSKVSIDTSLPLGLDLKITYGHYPLAVPNSVFNEYARRIKQAFAEFYDYIGQRALLPDIEMHLLLRDTVIKPPSEKVPIYVVWKRFENIEGKVHYMGNDEAIVNISQQNDCSQRGQIASKYEGLFDGDKGISLDVNIHHLFVAAGWEAISAYAAPLSEGVPLSVKHVTTGRINQELHDWWVKAGKPKKVGSDDINRIREEWDRREEGLIEGVIDCFVEGKLKELGIARAEYEKYILHGGHEQYKYVPAIRENVRELGAPAVFQIYLTDPDRLFE